MNLTDVRLQELTALIKPLEHEARELDRQAVRERNRTVTVQGAERKLGPCTATAHIANHGPS